MARTYHTEQKCNKGLFESLDYLHTQKININVTLLQISYGQITESPRL